MLTQPYAASVTMGRPAARHSGRPSSSTFPTADALTPPVIAVAGWGIVVGAYGLKGWHVIAVAGWGISRRVGAYRVRLRRVVAGIVRRAIAVTRHSSRCDCISRAAACPAVNPPMDARNACRS